MEWKEITKPEYKWLGTVEEGKLIHYLSPEDTPWRPGNVLRYHNGELYVICGCGRPLHIDGRWTIVRPGEPNMTISGSIHHNTPGCGWHYNLNSGAWTG